MGYIILSICAITTIIYFAIIRSLIKRDLLDDIDELSQVFGLVLMGIIPIVNVIIAICVLIAVMIEENDLDAQDILKKILFIREEKKDDKNSFEREGYR